MASSKPAPGSSFAAFAEALRVRLEKVLAKLAAPNHRALPIFE